jgi:hypothetical protein
MTRLTDVVGIGEVYEAKLIDAGIESLGQLLEAGSNPTHRKRLSEETGISSRRLLGWIKKIDPFEAIFIEVKYIRLLEAAGVDSISEIISYDPLDLFELLVDVNKDSRLVKKLPSPKRVEDWIKTAKNLQEVE